MMDKKVLNVVKLVLMGAGFAVQVASSIIAGKELDNKIAEKAQEVFTDMTKGDA